MSAPIPDIDYWIRQSAGQQERIGALEAQVQTHTSALSRALVAGQNQYAALEAQVRQLREALEEIRRITSGENDFYEDDSAGIVAIDKIAIAALAATQEKTND